MVVRNWIDSKGQNQTLTFPHESAPTRNPFTNLDCATRAMVRRVEQGSLHFAETDNGHLLICAASLEK
ncbi:MAG: hypothetical protein H0X72_11505 [Acidobacteria bacterium]|jgi:hypothetical protein|nr:hypothetical protein [Acidobacteriota bacterium]